MDFSSVHFISFLSLVHITLSCFKRKMSLSPDMYYSIALQNLLNKGKNNAIHERQTKDYIMGKVNQQEVKVERPVETSTPKSDKQEEPVKTEVEQPVSTTKDEVPSITLDEHVQQENFKHYPYYYQPPEESYPKYTSVIIVVIIIIMLFFMYYQYVVNKKIMKKYKKLHAIIKALNK